MQTYTIASAQASDTGNYTVIVSNALGSATSAVATVTVVFPPSITVPPQSQDVAAGTSLSLAVLASGTAPLELSMAQQRRADCRRHQCRLTR